VRAGRLVLPAMLAIFAASQAVFLFDWYRTPAWAAFTRWFLSLPLT